MKKSLLILSSLICVLSLIACGGGGGSNPVGYAPALTNSGITSQVRGKVTGAGDLSNIAMYLVADGALISPTASIRAQTTQGNTDGQIYFCHTGNEGSFIFNNVRHGRYNLVARKDKYNSGILNNLEVGPQASLTNNEVILSLKATGDITGTVMAPAGYSPVSGIVTFVAGTSYSAFTDNAGKFTITGVPVGTYTVIFSGKGLLQHSEENISVTGAKVTTMSGINLSIDSSTSDNIVWQGTLPQPPANPKTNWAYYNSTDKKAYIWDGTTWQIMAESITGDSGVVGDSISWQGTLNQAPANPQKNWAYYNSTDKNSYIWDGTTWQIMAGSAETSGSGNVSIVWKGRLTAPPENPQLNWGYYNSTDGNAYIYDGNSWTILVEGREVDKPIISNVSAAVILPSVVVTWETNEDSKSLIEYGTTTAYGNSITLDDNFRKNHSISINASGSYDGVLHHYRAKSIDAAGNTQVSEDKTFTVELSTQHIGTADASTRGEAVCHDGLGNMYIAGHTSGALDGNVLTGVQDFFISKFDSVGNKQWTKQMGVAAKYTGAYGIACDSTGNVYVTGLTSGAFDGNVLTGVSDFFISKFDSAGNKQWIKQMGSAGSLIFANGIACDSTGNVYVTGYTKGALDGNVLTGVSDFFISKFDSAGNKQWIKQMGVAAKNSSALDIACDSTGNVYVTGSTSGAFDGNVLTGRSDFFISKFDSAGNKQWIKQMGSAWSYSYTSGIACDSTGNVYVTGHTKGALDGNVMTGVEDFFISKFDSAGNKQWLKQMGAAGVKSNGKGIVCDSTGNVYVNGHTKGALDGNVLTGVQDFFISKFDSAGNKQWIKQMGTVGKSVFGQGIACDASGNAYITGNTDGRLVNNVLYGSHDAFIHRIPAQ